MVSFWLLLIPYVIIPIKSCLIEFIVSYSVQFVSYLCYLRSTLHLRLRPVNCRS